MAKRIKAKAEESGARPRRTRSASSRASVHSESTPIWQIAQELAAMVPDRVWKKVPRDLSKRVDYYVYVRPHRDRS